MGIQFSIGQPTTTSSYPPLQSFLLPLHHKMMISFILRSSLLVLLINAVSMIDEANADASPQFPDFGGQVEASPQFPDFGSGFGGSGNVEAFGGSDFFDHGGYGHGHGHGGYGHKKKHGGYGHKKHGGYGHKKHGGYGKKHGGYGHKKHGGYGKKKCKCHGGYH